MPGELFEIEGEKKKRVVRADFHFFSLLLQSRVLTHAFPTRAVLFLRL